MHDKKVSIEEVVAELKADKAAEQKKADVLRGLEAEHQERERERREREAVEAEAFERVRREREEAEIERRVRVRFPGMPEHDFKRRFSELRDKLLLEEAEARGRYRHPLYNNF